jgi:cyclase
MPAVAAIEHFHVEEALPGIYVAITDDPLGLANHSNSVFIVGKDDVIVVDSQFTIRRTQAVMAAIDVVADSRVKTLINTHWHDDHTFGNQVYPGTFPGVEIIAHANTKRDMETAGVENRAKQVAGGADALKLFRDAVQSQTAIDGTPMSPEERAAYLSTITIVDGYLSEQPRFELTLPTRTFTNKLVLKQGDRVVELRYLGPAVTRGDAVVWLPAKRVLITGDLVSYPVPFAYGCDLDGWIRSLDELIALKPDYVIPGHGGVAQSDAPIRTLRDRLTSLRDACDTARKAGQTAADVRNGVVALSIIEAIAQGDKMVTFLAGTYFVGPVIASAFAQEP